MQCFFKSIYLFMAVALLAVLLQPAAAQDKPNILVIWGDETSATITTA